MAVSFRTLIFLNQLVLFSISVLPFCSSQRSTQNIEAFYPTLTPPPISSNPVGRPPESSLPPPPPSSSETSLSSEAEDHDNRTIAKAVAATAASTIVIAVVFFFFIKRYVLDQRKRRVPPDEFARVNGNIKGLIVDENGLDVLYWRQLQNGGAVHGFRQEVLHVPKDEEEGGHGGMVRKGSRSKKIEPINEIPLLGGKSSTPHVPPPEDDDSSPPPPMPPPPPPPRNRAPAAPPPPPVQPKGPAPPSPPSKKAGGLVTSLKPPPAARDKSGRGKAGESSGDGDINQVKLKPLHWDKVKKKSGDHSMVWDKINDGSFKFDVDLMEVLFGYVATNKKSPTSEKNTKIATISAPAQIMVLDARKSQNIAIVLKSLVLSRKELLDALDHGQGLEAETLEKLMRIAPTEEEQSQILDFDGDPIRLADAESFLFHLLKAVPSAFTRLTAMQFRSNYGLEILRMKECLQTLESGCNELLYQRLFMKLLEAILKAGNRMNAGTSRGNAQAFNLTSSNGIAGNSTSKEDREKEYVTLGLPVVGGLSAEFSNVKKAAAIDFNTFSTTCSALAARVEETKQLVLQCTAGEKGGLVHKMKGFIADAEHELKVLREEQERVMDIVRRTTEYFQAGASKDPFQVFVIVKDFLGMVHQACVEIARNHQKRKSSTANYGAQSPSSDESRTKNRFPMLPENFMSDKSSESVEDS
ncbi:formin 8, FORMIN HOMOLOGUE 8 [Hibiscus trionum]|uniref:Formin-like protein n=1 Tax=Hibiscus trionum TaxID=183268 RepID=A0A9W7GYD9_HIBTR|nr:formin 8, FORMIN HOMOLOGUE 8 [Hibiscus trionum]